MPTATVRYGRPKGSGLDDRQQLQTLAALLAANPKLKPTTAIRQLGVEDPSTIRRLRDKFRVEQAKLMADARRATRAKSTRGLRAVCNENTPAPEPAPSRALVPVAPPLANDKLPTPVATAVLADCCDLAFAMLSAATEAQAVLAEHWLRQPLVAATLRRQLALNSVAVAVYSRCSGRRRVFH